MQPAVAGLLGASRADGSHGRIFVGACAGLDAYASGVSTAVEEARRDGGRHIVVKVIEQPGGRILSAVYAREGRL